MSIPCFAEDSNVITLAPILSQLVQKLDEDADKYDFLMVFLICVMAESGYRVSCLYDDLKGRRDVACKLIGLPVGDWMVLNLLPLRASSRCATRSIAVNVSKYVNMHQKELQKFWHLKELSLRYKNNLLAPLHGEMLIEIGVASPSLQGLPAEIKAAIARKLDEDSRQNLERIWNTTK